MGQALEARTDSFSNVLGEGSCLSAWGQMGEGHDSGFVQERGGCLSGLSDSGDGPWGRSAEGLMPGSGSLCCGAMGLGMGLTDASAGRHLGPSGHTANFVQSPKQLKQP